MLLLEIIFNISSIFPLSLVAILTLATFVFNFLLVASVFLSLYTPISSTIQWLIAIGFLLLNMVHGTVELGNDVVIILYVTIIVFWLYTNSLPKRFSGIKPVPIIAAFILCGVIVFALSLATKDVESDNNDDILDSKEKYVTCSECSGEGEKYVNSSCPDCNGIGKIRKICSRCDGYGKSSTGRVCSDCVGNGYVLSTCNECGGDGDVRSRSECYACDGEGKIKNYD